MLNIMPVAFITGAGRGIGQALACALAEDGYGLALASRSIEQLRETEQAIKRLRPDCEIVLFSLDVGDPSAVEKAVKETMARFGQIDLLFNNAGQYLQGSWEVGQREFEQLMRVNLHGAFNCSKAVIPHMKQRAVGYIMNVSSICGLHGFAGVGVYSASKFALRGLSESLFRELLPDGIRVTTLCPSWVNTEMSKHGPMSDERKIQPDDVVKTVRFLLSLSPGACINEIVIQCSSDPV